MLIKIYICDICGERGAKIRYVSRSYGKNENLFVIEDVPVISCPHCDKSYLTAETLHEIAKVEALILGNADRP